MIFLDAGQPRAYSSGCIKRLESRINEIQYLFFRRHGYTLPADDAGREDAALMARHLAAVAPHRPADRERDPGKIIRNFLEIYCPWLPSDEIDNIVADSLRNCDDWLSDAALGKALNLTAAERSRYVIRTIDAVDQTKAERIKAQRAKERAKKERQRRAKGVQVRADYEANSASRLKPWELMNMSRATWYRAGKPETY